MKNKKTTEEIKYLKKIKKNEVNTGLENENYQKNDRVLYRESIDEARGYKAKPKNSNDEIPEAPEDGPEL